MSFPRLSSWFPKRRASADWRASLTEPHLRAYRETVSDLECALGMLGVTLNEALGLRAEGSLVQAREEAAVAAELMDRLASRLRACFQAMEEQGRHLGDLPDVMPLDAANFRGGTAQRLAGWNLLLHGVLFGLRTRFFHKVSVIDDLVESLAREFRETAEEISEGASVRPEKRWAALDSLHYDVNTCLQETVVVLKSFLLCLPPEQVDAFARRLAGVVPAESRRPARPRAPHFSRTRR